MRSALVLACVLGCAATASALFAADLPSDQVAAKLQGKWRIVAVEQDGKAIPDAALEKSPMFTFDEGKLGFTLGDETRIGEYKLDAAKSPMHLDIEPQKGQESESIFKFDGDTLVICGPWQGGRGKRPTEFKAPAGSGLALMRLERVK